MVELGIFVMKIDNIVGNILSLDNVNHFTAVELRTAYLAMKGDPNLDPNYARRFVYTELLKLVKKGWLRKSISKKKAITTFVKTEDFNPNELDFREEYKTVNSGNSSGADEAINKQLIERLAHYKNELLSGLGEADEYKQLCNKFPELCTTLQPKYNLIREQNSKLLGSIRAIENLTLNKQ
ncbi:hypothetical protein PCIT_a4006 [Pseudoalteromonas citrea]|uniref:Response regulator n=2 Tax=Pseudoalteromonas citrea TaxID=43655 RepID=A0AAD4AIU8_9GAMM|nr:hypothetical protein [Pseudoalteromonas citrea]KAF7771431.1 hypothetical protein PCIT_a4006 [Pseudoalteromonas citrea]